MVVRRHIEALRRIKYRPTGGFAQFCFADGHPAVTWSVLGHDRAPKAGYEALREACRPVIVVADRLPERRSPPGRRSRSTCTWSATCARRSTTPRSTARLEWTGGSRTWRWRGDIPADGVPARRHRADRRARRARARSSLDARTAGTAASRSTTATRRRSSPLTWASADSRAICGPGSRFGLDGDDVGQRPERPPTAPIHPRRARRAPWPVEFYRSAVGKKWVMAITGLALIGFVFVHALGNLKVYFGRRRLQPLRRVAPQAPRAVPPPHRVPVDPAHRPHHAPSPSTSTPPTRSPG